MTKINNVFETRKNAPPLDTLAQLVTSPEKEALKLAPQVRLSDKGNLKKRARRKFFTNGLIFGLINAADRNKNSILKKSYWNTYHCNSGLDIYSTGEVVGKYCKNRWCMVCNAIRTAKSILTYVPIIENWEDAYFCTVTRPNVKAENLKTEIKELHEIFNRIKQKIKQQNHRKKIYFQLVGIRKFECTYNSISNTYHPHFHIVFKDEDMAIIFMDEWMKRNPTANSKGQDMRPADGNSTAELFKYMTKVISKTGKGNRVIYADAMDIIFNVMKGRRIMQSFGFKLPKIDDDDDGQNLDRELVKDVVKWHQDAADWVNEETGELFTGYVPSEKFKKFVKTKIICR